MADRVMVLENGVITGQGTIDELDAKKDGYLAGMARTE